MKPARSGWSTKSCQLPQLWGGEHRVKQCSLPASCVDFLRLIVLALLVCGGMPRAASALQATPTASPTAVTCHVAPRSTAEILALTGTNTSETEPTTQLPAGDEADAETTEAISAMLREMAACLSSGDMLRFYVLHSDDWLQRSLGIVDGMAILTTSIPPLDDGDRARYVGPWHVQILPDGRVLAAVLLVVGDDPRPDPNRTRVLLFVHRNGRWFVDETIASVRVADCTLPVDVAAVVGPPPGALFDFWSASCG
jgi:hypothetical protein